MANETPNIHVDSDWKAQAEAERERLQKLDAAHAKGQPAAAAFPPADLRSLVGLLATQALGGLGAYGDPKTNRVMVDLDQAQFAIDLLAVLEAKTKGNLSTEEAAELTAILAELRSRFVQISKLVAAQHAEAGGRIAPTPSAAAEASPASPTKPKLIIPS